MMRGSITTRSESWPEEQRLMQAKSRTHEILQDLLPNINKDIFHSHLVYSKITSEEEMSELAILHKEWFPVQYGEDFFQELLMGHENNFAYGVYLDNLQEIGNMGRELEILVGGISIRIQQEFCLQLQHPDQHIYNLCSLFRGGMAYIMTIGVIDELRRNGIASYLLNKTIELLVNTRPEVKGLCLHVIDHNQSAIHFYIKNGFTVIKTIPDYYLIDGINYSAFWLCKYLYSEPANLPSGTQPTEKFNRFKHIIHKLRLFCRWLFGGNKEELVNTNIEYIV